MTNEQFQREKIYQFTMLIARKLLKQGIISEDEYKESNEMFTKQYTPSLGIIFADIELTNIQNVRNS